MYYGTQTTPPCLENHYHLVLDKPVVISVCQFKLLRENTLVSDRPKETHARLTQSTNNRIVYRFGNNQFKLLESIAGFIPVEFNQFILLKGGFKKAIQLIKSKLSAEEAQCEV